MSQNRLIVGCMSGTSLDGIDAVLAKIVGRDLNLTAEFVCLHSIDIPTELKAILNKLAEGNAEAPLCFMKASRHLGELHAQLISELIEQNGLTVLDISFAVVHGQTIWHAPQDHLSYQLFDPQPIVRRLGIPVVYDLRQADLAAGGQGAPITPLADYILYKNPNPQTASNNGRSADTRVIVNLGGICNITVLSLEKNNALPTVRGADVSPCNLLLDPAYQLLRPQCEGEAPQNDAFDMNGAFASQGRCVEEEVLATATAVQQHVFFRSDRSTGREDFDRAWAQGIVRATQGSAEQKLRTCVEAIAHIIASKLPKGPADVILAGGGVRNRTLTWALQTRCPDKIIYTSEDFGIPSSAREALGFCVLGALSADGVPITLPAVTGSEGPGVAGVWAGLTPRSVARIFSSPSPPPPQH
eukprot:GCRY01004377.1.p1 GENE.GCRY01004377.1~~GCRY01004377.1.p1  ORF type:complete len:414 (-),score=89.91 GCRY01004377.1:29-1270(-)